MGVLGVGVGAGVVGLWWMALAWHVATGSWQLVWDLGHESLCTFSMYAGHRLLSMIFVGCGLWAAAKPAFSVWRALAGACGPIPANGRGAKRDWCGWGGCQLFDLRSKI